MRQREGAGWEPGGRDLRNLGINSLIGTVPTELGELTAMTYMNLGITSLIGTVPTELGELTAMTVLNLFINSLIGTVPTELGELTAMVYMSFYSNSLTGTVPTELGELTVMTELNIDYNSLRGTVPTELGELTVLLHINLQINSLTGTVPTELGELTAMTYMHLYVNSLTGTVPTELGELTAMTAMSLKINSLRGTVPTELGELTAMTALRTNCHDDLAHDLTHVKANCHTHDAAQYFPSDCDPQSLTHDLTHSRAFTFADAWADYHTPDVISRQQQSCYISEEISYQCQPVRLLSSVSSLPSSSSTVCSPTLASPRDSTAAPTFGGHNKPPPAPYPPPLSAPPPPPPPPCLPPPPPPGFAALPVTRSPEESEATTVAFTFGGDDVVMFACQLDEGPMTKCTSPREVTWLVAGNHTFAVNATLESGVVLKKEHRWTVAPRLRFAADAVHARLNTQNLRTEFLELQSTSFEAIYVTSSDFFIEQVLSWENVAAYTSKGTRGVFEVILDASQVNGTATRNFTVVVVVADNHAVDFTSVINATILVAVYAQSTLLLMPPSGDVVPFSGQQAYVVVAGQEPTIIHPYIINVGTGVSAHDGGAACSSATRFSITARDNQTWVSVEPNNGTLTTTGDVQTLRIVFLQMHKHSVTNQIATFHITNTVDGVVYVQELRVLLTVVSDVISNRSMATRADAGLALQTGGSAKWTVTPLDRFGNALAEGDDNFLVDVFRTELHPGTRKELDGQPAAHFNESTGRYTSQVDSMIPYGAYVVYVRFVDREQQQEALEELPAWNWTDPQGCALQNTPLEYNFSPASCNEEFDRQVADELGLSCECMAGYYNAASDTDGQVSCEACGYGRYGPLSTTHGRDEACRLCNYEGATDGHTTLRSDEVSQEECVCAEGYHHAPDELRRCTPCEPGYYQDQLNSSSCTACPIGTHSEETGRVDVCSEECVEREVAPMEGLAKCLSCAPNTHAEYTCLFNGSWYMDRAFCHEFAADTLQAVCVCNDGFYQSDTDKGGELVNQTCERCSEGAQCNYGLMRGLASYWRGHTGHTKFYKCNPDDICLGEVTSETYETDAMLHRYFETGQVEVLESTQLSSCREGHDAVLCGACQDGWALGDDGYCKDCGTKRALWVYVLLGVSLLLLVAWLQRPFYQDVELVAREKALSVVRQARASSASSLTQIRHLSVSALQKLRATNKAQKLPKSWNVPPNWQKATGRDHGDVCMSAGGLELERVAILRNQGSILEAAPNIASHVVSPAGCEERAGTAAGAVDDISREASGDAHGKPGQASRMDLYAAMAADTQTSIRMRRMQSSSSRSSTDDTVEKSSKVNRIADEELVKGNCTSSKRNPRAILKVLKDEQIRENVSTLADHAEVDIPADSAPATEPDGHTPAEQLGLDLKSLTQLATVLLSFSQILASFGTVYNVAWPHGFLSLLRSLQMFNFSIPSISGLPDAGCSLGGLTFLTWHAMCILTPFAGVAFMWIVAAVSFRTQQKKYLTNLIEYKMFIIRTTCFILYISYICISTIMLSYFNCVAVHHEYYLVSDLRVQCWVGPHRRNIPLAVLGVLLYPIGLPAFFYMFMRKQRVPWLAKMKQRAYLLHAARIILDPTYATREFSQDPIFALETITFDELSALVAKMERASGNTRNSELGNDGNQPAHVTGTNALMHLTRIASPTTSTTLAPPRRDTGAAPTDTHHHSRHTRTCSSDAVRDPEMLIDQLLQWMSVNHGDMRYSLRVYWNVAAATNHGEEEKCGEMPVRSQWARLEAEALMHAGFIFGAYHVEVWWYDVGDLLRKQCLACAIVFLDDVSITQIIVGMTICFSAICVNLSLHPDATPLVQMFTTATHGVLLYTLVLGIYLTCMETTGVADLLIWPVLLVYVGFFVYVAFSPRHIKEPPMHRNTEMPSVHDADGDDDEHVHTTVDGGNGDITTRSLSLAMSEMFDYDYEVTVLDSLRSASMQDESEIEVNNPLSDLNRHTAHRSPGAADIDNDRGGGIGSGSIRMHHRRSIAMTESDDCEHAAGMHHLSNDVHGSVPGTEIRRMNPLYAEIQQR
ncbi:hypothetical protein CYMTET_7021 [Cymbomonas tetramitiformis]|uniref:Tyrosine-protein kinase ephrin type A/B receptor-like domain-containing protein n=1 Tax=Cymbomonas tetramitiformis TaxID=36881 RepID=A0AAE0GWA8_9CHLO|nr:hypothetical protein CYMTET_7021 [Cymbomonas tetramitiformis]